MGVVIISAFIPLTWKERLSETRVHKGFCEGDIPDCFVAFINPESVEGEKPQSSHRFGRQIMIEGPKSSAAAFRFDCWLTQSLFCFTSRFGGEPSEMNKIPRRQDFSWLSRLRLELGCVGGFLLMLLLLSTLAFYFFPTHPWRIWEKNLKEGRSFQYLRQ